VRKPAVAVLAFGLVLAGCSSHYFTKQIEMVATLGQRSGDAELAQEAAGLQMDLRRQSDDVSTVIEVVKITERCNRLGALPSPTCMAGHPTNRHSRHYGHNNFAQPHRTLTKRSGLPTTPAMAAGKADHEWSVWEIAGLLD
jgi:hypothetical protein